MLNAGADTKLKNYYRDTALLIASARGSEEIVRILITAGVDIRAKNYCGLNALKIAEEHHHYSVVNILKAK
ncbi:MAG: hypothetical protein A2Y62_04745 [Candidatus Fischerbacteria bacterium RBG_13_37_8]|uniref:Uncharacterized protein n=1 Tax=Candidatus Fischerbacteria bacterium RBG_13_37_8 TaxID=1817863 RepID=A0A1F5VUJ1_9BACT|nr:MAG: hypothetical protein A2Y62_04745 [Candidatus Fischerbacteria bacterium RBG_13_37_8]